MNRLFRENIKGVRKTEDSKILELFCARDEKAISETHSKYGRYCYSIAYNIIGVNEDCEECVNDTLVKAWNTIPPQKPRKLSAFLGRITRNLTLNKYFEKTAGKRGAGQTAAVLDELSECVSSGVTTEDISDNNTLRRALNDFLSSLEPEKRIIFMQRYWYMISIKAIADKHSSTESRIKMILLRTRNELKEHLIKEGITL